MSETPSHNESREMLKWLNHNRQMLLDLYRNQYVAYNANGLIAHSENLREVILLIREKCITGYYFLKIAKVGEKSQFN
ncbi:MAG: DUF5678 domain-containing protein [Rhizonema sp. PD37]|nr:DUF5678 domain-containing protein [Rhizonema sp. PD37]